MQQAHVCCLSSTRTHSKQLACSSGTHTVECVWHRGLFQPVFSLLAMPGDIFVFIAGAGSCLQVLIIDCSSSTREPVCEPPFSPPGSHYHMSGPSLQLEMSCLGWSWWCRWCHLRHALPAGVAPGQLPLPPRRSFVGGEKPKCICTSQDSRGWQIPLQVRWLLQHPTPGLMDLQSPEEACPALNVARSFQLESKKHLKNRGNLVSSVSHCLPSSLH